MATADRNRGTVSCGWIAALQETRKEIEPEVPKGFYTTDELARHLGKSASTTGRLIRELLAAGKLDVKTIKRPTSGGVYKPVRHFRPKKGKFV